MKCFLEVAVLVEQALVVGWRRLGVGEVGLDRVHPILQIEQRLKCAARFVEQRPAGVYEAILRKIAGQKTCRLDDRSAVGLVETGQDAQERCLTGAVRPRERDALPRGDLPRDRLEQDLVAKRLREGLQLNHEPDAVIRAHGRRFSRVSISRSYHVKRTDPPAHSPRQVVRPAARPGLSQPQRGYGGCGRVSLGSSKTPRLMASMALCLARVACNNDDNRHVGF